MRAIYTHTHERRDFTIKNYLRALVQSLRGWQGALFMIQTNIPMINHQKNVDFKQITITTQALPVLKEPIDCKLWLKIL